MSTYQPKISTTQKYSDSQGKHIACEGKLLLIETDWQFLTEQSRKYLGNVKASIIISETESPKIGDWVYNRVSKHSSTNSHIYKIKKKQLYNANQSKILALPEHFSDKHLQIIADGKMKDGNGVLVKCEDAYEESYGEVNGVYIHLDQQNHITLFPAEQSLEEAAERYSENTARDINFHNIEREYIAEEAFKDGAEWAKKNNY